MNKKLIVGILSTLAVVIAYQWARNQPWGVSLP